MLTRKPPGIVTLTTDFGSDGPYVAALKGVLLTHAPDAILVDVSHDVAPQNVLEGGFVLASILEAFPEGTVHLAVVDPGVGTNRALVAVLSAGQWFVAPDNGLLGGVVRRHPPEGIWEITNPALRRPVVSSTFYGRDILAPAAAHLLLGRCADELGARRDTLARLLNFDPRPDDDGGWLGEVIFRDRFGNLVTNLRAELIEAAHPRDWTIEVANQQIKGLVRTYGDRSGGSLVALVGSSGWVEVAVVNGDASRTLSAGPGTTVRFWRRETFSIDPSRSLIANL